MVIALNFVFDIIVAILVYEYFKRDKKIEAFAAAVIIKVAYFLSSTVIMGQFNFLGFIIYILVMICVARLYIGQFPVSGEWQYNCWTGTEIYKTELHPVLFIFVTALIGALIMSLIGEILYTLLFKLVTLFAATFQYTLDKIS